MADHSPNCVAYDGLGKSLAHIQRHWRPIDLKANTRTVKFKFQAAYGPGGLEGIGYSQTYISQKVTDESSQRRLNFIAVDSNPHGRYSITAIGDIDWYKYVSNDDQAGHFLEDSRFAKPGCF
jgi:hypothetical protein